MGFKKAKITTTLVEALKPGETVMDTELPGYLVRRQLGEARIYAVRKHANGKRHFETVGEHGREGWTEVRARRKALDIISALRNGLDPATERLKVKAMPTLAEWAETFFDKHGPTLETQDVRRLPQPATCPYSPMRCGRPAGTKLPGAAENGSNHVRTRASAASQVEGQGAHRQLHAGLYWSTVFKGLREGRLPAEDLSQPSTRDQKIPRTSTGTLPDCGGVGQARRGFGGS